jgi:hypothetical protein
MTRPRRRRRDFNEAQHIDIPEGGDGGSLHGDLLSCDWPCRIT